MLAGLRSAAKSKWAIPIIVFLAASFAIWGVNDAFTGGPRDAVATVGGQKVTVNEYSRNLRQQLQQMSQEGRGLTMADARQAGLDQQLLNQLVVGAAIDAKTDRLQLGASDVVLARDLQQTEAFRDTVRGEFSRDVYRSALAGAGMRESEYEAAVRRDFTREQLLRAVMGPVRTPAVLAESRSSWRNETRTIETLILPAGLADLDEAPDEAALQSLLDANRDVFTFPERRALTVVWLDMRSMQALVEISDDDLEALFEFRRASLSSPATRDFTQIAAPDEAVANEALALLEAGETPEAAAASLDLAPPIENPAARRDDIVDAVIAEQIFDSLEPRDFAAEGRLGWAVIRVTGGTEAQEPDLAAQQESLRAELAEDGALETLYQAISDLEDARGAGYTLEESAVATGVPAHSYEPVDAQARDDAGALHADLASAPAVMAAAFNLGPGETSGLLELPDGGYAMLRVDGITPQRVAELDEVRDSVMSLWRSRLVSDSLDTLEASVRTRIEAGETFGEIAAGLGAPARSELAILRRGQTAGPVNAQLAASLFGAAPNELVSGAGPGQARVIARVTRIGLDEEPDPGLRTELADEITNDLLLQFQEALLDEYEVRIYQEQIDLVLGDAPQ